MSEDFDPRELPDVRVGTLSHDELDALLRDLKECAEVIHVSIRRGGQRLADEAVMSLDEAAALLVAGDAQGMQVQYRHDGRDYRDTIMRAGDGFRVVRM